jgi:CRISPR system Cascade subunit CasB
MSRQVHEQRQLGSIVGGIAAVIDGEHFGTGERAALRRMRFDQPPPLTFYRFALKRLPANWDVSEDVRRDWMTLVAGIALMSPGGHRPDKPFGAALAEQGYSEARLERLLSTAGDTRRELLLRTLRFLSSKNASCDFVQVARLLHARDSDVLEQCRRRIARDFYSKNEKTA